MTKSYMMETNSPAHFEEASQGKSGAILGKLHAPFFDLNNPTRNGRNYSEAAEAALNSEEFKEKMATRTFFGRLGHPMTDEESREDPAVRACVIMTDYQKNPKTNMYEADLEILNNQYGRQLKSLIDAGCVMGVSTRGSGDSYEAADGSEMIRDYEFENLDVVTLPAVKAARVTVVESVEKNKRKKLEELIESTNDKYVLESLKVTVESSEMANKKKLLEAINKKLSGGTETIESLANDIAMLSSKLTESESKIADLERQLTEAKQELQESKSSTGTTESDKMNVSESTKKFVTLLKSSTNVIESMKKDLLSKNSEMESIKEVVGKSKSVIESLKADVTRLTTKCEELSTENSGLLIANQRLTESLDSLSKELNEARSEASNSAKLTESVNKSSSEVKKLTEAIKATESKNKELESRNSSLSKSLSETLTKYIESAAVAYGISLESLKSKLGANPTAKLIDSTAKSIRESEDARRSALPDITQMGTKVESVDIKPYDPEMDRAARVAAMVASHK